MTRATGLLTRLSVAAVVIATIWVVAPVPASAMTTGEFAALLVNYGNTGTPVSQDKAVQQLKSLGVNLGPVNATLTEAQLAKIMNAFGVHGSTGNPKGAVDDLLANAVASILSTTALYRTGAEQGKGYPRAGEIGLCLSLRNFTQCMRCCQDQTSPVGACTTFCTNLEPPSSPTP